MAHKAQPLGLQIPFRTPDDQLCQPFWTVNEEKVAAEFQRPGGRSEQVGEQASSRRARAALRLAGPPEK